MTYERWKVRVSLGIFHHCRQVAHEKGWEFSDFLRALIFLSANAKFLNLPDNEVVKELAAWASVFGGRRQYPSPVSSELVSVHLPSGFADALRRYARWTGRSRSSVVEGMIEAGLVMYFKAHVALLKTIKEVADKPLPPTLREVRKQLEEKLPSKR